MSGLRIQDACGKTGRIVVARLLPDTDLIEGIAEACRKNGIKQGYVSLLGSLKRCGYKYAVPVPESKIGVAYGELWRVEGPLEIINCSGMICQKDGQYDLHIHGSMCDKKGAMFGGHIVPGENITAATIDAMIWEVTDLTMARAFDDETDLVQLSVTT
jgi:predicted DNA-binding protein with PD1-like motif